MFVAPRKQIRLMPDQYIGRAIYFVAICARGRRPIFSDANRCQVAIDALKRTAASAHFLVHAFCFMPTTCTFLLKGKVPVPTW
jgi:REP element-mobilizing transposase RayT